MALMKIDVYRAIGMTKRDATFGAIGGGVGLVSGLALSVQRGSGYFGWPALGIIVFGCLGIGISKLIKPNN